jgi:glycosyltransferase involved in cell wall biosynthesis
VLAQQVKGMEVLVIDDGTAAPHAAPLTAIEAGCDARVRFLHLPPSVRGHGPSHAMNTGAAAARGRYLCFLDDDDAWSDPRYLACAAGLIETAAPALDLLRAHGFCHLNTTIVRRDFFNAIGGFDPALRYEQDRDFYLRAIDAAQAIAYVPRTVSRHNVPDPARRDNMSTLVSDIEKRTLQIILLDKAIRDSRQEVVRAYARRHRGYSLKHMTMALYRAGHYRQARPYAVAALAAKFNPKWAAFCAWLTVLAAFRGK